MPSKKPASHGLHTHIPTGEAKRVLFFCQQSLKILRLAHWLVSLADEPAEEDCYAETRTTSGRYIVTVYLPADWTTNSTDLKRRTLFHEMLHLTHAQQEHGIRTILEDSTALSKDTWDSFFDTYRLNTEYMVDNLCHTFWYQGLIPKWPTATQVAKLNNVTHST